MRDSEIEQWVINEIRLMTDGRLKELCVFSLDGVVSLKGTVHSRGDKLAAQQAAARAKGAVGVINQLSLRRARVVRRRTSIESPVVLASGTFQLPLQAAASSHLSN